jgi:2-amino-4-hydroxy-6-hydroxymethyldihydropteridine diphosphokinase
MSLVIATGSNLGDSCQILEKASDRIAQELKLIKKSRIYCSSPMEYENQPDFFNQVLEFNLPAKTPSQVMSLLLDIEAEFGRTRLIPKGPRTLDIDIILWGFDKIIEPALIIPHPRWLERSFVVRPLQELPFFKSVEKCFTIPKTFAIEASPIL